MGFYSYSFLGIDFFHNTLGFYLVFPYLSWAFLNKNQKSAMYEIVKEIWLKKNGKEVILRTIDQSFHKLSITDIHRHEIIDHDKGVTFLI